MQRKRIKKNQKQIINYTHTIHRIINDIKFITVNYIYLYLLKSWTTVQSWESKEKRLREVASGREWASEHTHISLNYPNVCEITMKCNIELRKTVKKYERDKINFIYRFLRMHRPLCSDLNTLCVRESIQIDVMWSQDDDRGRLVKWIRASFFCSMSLLMMMNIYV